MAPSAVPKVDLVHQDHYLAIACRLQNVGGVISLRHPGQVIQEIKQEVIDPGNDLGIAIHFVVTMLLYYAADSRGGVYTVVLRRSLNKHGAVVSVDKCAQDIAVTIDAVMPPQAGELRAELKDSAATVAQRHSMLGPQRSRMNELETMPANTRACVEKKNSLYLLHLDQRHGSPTTRETLVAQIDRLVLAGREHDDLVIITEHPSQTARRIEREARTRQLYGLSDVRPRVESSLMRWLDRLDATTAAMKRENERAYASIYRPTGHQVSAVPHVTPTLDCLGPAFKTPEKVAVHGGKLRGDHSTRQVTGHGNVTSRRRDHDALGGGREALGFADRPQPQPFEP